VPQEFNFNTFEKVVDIVVQQAGYYGLPRKLALERAEKYLKQLDLWDKRDVQSRMLSGGMKRRLMIARALMHEPKILILDEPTAGVDIEIRRTMWTFLTELNRQGIAIILTTHYLEEAESLCRNLAIIGKGDIIAQGATKELLKEKASSTFVVDVQEAVTAIPEALQAFDARVIDDYSMEFSIRKDASLNRVFDLLNFAGINAISIRPKTNRLEELFVDLTGSKMEEESGSES
jgi:ABC-2 type transport system ATP-binding protein